MTAATIALAVLAALAWCAACARSGLVAARMFQIEEYERARFLRWGIAPAWALHRAALCGGAVVLVAVVAAVFVRDETVRIIATGWLLGSLTAALLWRWTAAKKALVLTARMRRLLAASAGVTLVVAGVITALLLTGVWPAAAALALLSVLLLPVATQCLLVTGDVVLIPVEQRVREGYLRAARTRLAAVSPQVVAVAGSYGKTSTKHILAALLQPSIDTLPTRQSFNTLMGVTRVINEDLQQRHRVFVVEMDAYAPGEIASISALVHPSLAVLTSVGPQHLERFRTMERIAAALYEVVAALPPGGTAVIEGSEPWGRRLADRARDEGRNVVAYGAGEDVQTRTVDVLASDVQVDGSGARFRWNWPGRTLTRDVQIPLLGLHQVLNVTAALAVVVLLDKDLDAAVAAAASLQPVEHRLQVVPSGGPLTVIDDSYNANPVGVHNALDVLATMNSPRKILVTPGLVELGSVEEEENRRYGEHAAHVCSEVIVMDARPAAALRRGLLSGGLPPEHIHVVRSLDDATAVITRLGKPGDVVLFANDLPDTYLPAS